MPPPSMGQIGQKYQAPTVRATANQLPTTVKDIASHATK